MIGLIQLHFDLISFLWNLLEILYPIRIAHFGDLTLVIHSIQNNLGISRECQDLILDHILLILLLMVILMLFEQKVLYNINIENTEEFH
jgi:hypothetical protein